MDTNKQLEILKSYLEENQIYYRENYHIKYETYFKTGGNVKFFITPQSCDKFKQLIEFLQTHQIKFKIIGFTSNIILFDEIEYSVIISTKNLISLEIYDDVIEVEAGYSLQDFVRVAAILNNSEGYEGLEGIPASIGGAIFMNAGAYGGYTISNNLISVECLDKNNKIVILGKKDCRFSARSSIFRRSGHYVILRAKFKIKYGDKDLIAKNIEKFHIARHSYQEFVYPNLGSMISSGDDVYKLIFRRDFLYTMMFWVLKYIFKNPLSKFLMRKRPNNIAYNRLLLLYLKNKKNIVLEHKLSPKSVNILINDGSLSMREIVNYVFLISDLTNLPEKKSHFEFHIENELVVDPIYKISPEFETTLNTIIDRLNNDNKK